MKNIYDVTTTIAAFRQAQRVYAPGRAFTATEKARIEDECADRGTSEAAARAAFHAAEDGKPHDRELAWTWANAARLALASSIA